MIGRGGDVVGWMLIVWGYVKEDFLEDEERKGRGVFYIANEVIQQGHASNLALLQLCHIISYQILLNDIAFIAIEMQTARALITFLDKFLALATTPASRHLSSFRCTL